MPDSRVEEFVQSSESRASQASNDSIFLISGWKDNVPAPALVAISSAVSR
jgi:hypothetical protein